MSLSLRVDHLSKCYRTVKNDKRRETWALKDVSVEVEQGTILGAYRVDGTIGAGCR